eukprot:6186652-Pleurochrysis_carterae.AAC.1
MFMTHVVAGAATAFAATTDNALGRCMGSCMSHYIEATCAQVLLKVQLCRGDEKIRAVPVLFLYSDTREQLLRR